MKYSKEFKNLLEHCTDRYIGHGNPNAKILFIGQEPAIDRELNAQDFARDIASNADQWRFIVSNSIGYESVDRFKIEFGHPLHPWANQKYQVRSEMQNGDIRGEQGTSRTWYNYQKLINKIYETYSNKRKPMTKDDYLDFHRYSFHTDMSAATFKSHRNTPEGSKSVIERMELLSNDFFHKFPIVIASVGHFPRDVHGDTYFGDVFGVEYLGSKNIQGMWMNINIRHSEVKPMLLIHTPQFSAAITDQYFEGIAQRVVDFTNDHNINIITKG